MQTLLIFLKAPVPGRVKTRLAKDLGAQAAADAYIGMAQAIVGEISRLPKDHGIRLQWVYAPTDDFPDLSWLGLPDAEFWPQAEGDLGARLKNGFERAFQAKADAVCVIGMDSPGLPATSIHAAFDSLREHDLTIGPTEDGGYYLLGMTRFLPYAFDGIPWSSDQVFAATMAYAKAAKLKVKTLPEYYDVDTLAEYERWQKD